FLMPKMVMGMIILSPSLPCLPAAGYTRESVMAELEYGPVYVFGGRHKGRILYYDDDYTSKTAICYIVHPLSFCGTFDVPLRFLREPTIDDLMKRREELWR